MPVFNKITDQLFAGVGVGLISWIANSSAEGNQLLGIYYALGH